MLGLSLYVLCLSTVHAGERLLVERPWVYHMVCMLMLTHHFLASWHTTWCTSLLGLKRTFLTALALVVQGGTAWALLVGFGPVCTALCSAPAARPGRELQVW